MAPNKTPRWMSGESVTTAEKSFSEAIKASPFNGTAVNLSLSTLVQAVEATVPKKTKEKGNILVDRAQYLLAKMGEAATAAVGTEHATIFEAQATGYRVMTGLNEGAEQSKGPSDLTQTSMSGAKSKI